MKFDEENNNYSKIKNIDIVDEIKNSFLDYAMSVIVSRAIPDIRDGLKPVHRRILYAMWNLNMTYDKQHKKSARIVGEVIGKYHPHGDIAVYDSMVRMAQYFSYRYPLIDGHGNFGSLDGDPAAAMRYTEARMSKIAGELIKNIDKETVIFSENYDSSEIEPLYLPGNFPNLLINGASGIAVGMATNIPPHNLTEIIDGVIAIIKNKDISIIDLMKIIKGPDFPTGGLITTGDELLKAYTTGNGSIKIRSKIDILEKNNFKKIIISEIPYQVNKVKIIEKIVSLIKEKKISGINEIRDESNHEGVRIIIELKKESHEKLILNKLYKLTPLQINFSFNILALYKNEPKIMGLKEILIYFIENQIEIIIKRSIYELNKLKNRLIILNGLNIALENIDEIIKIIKNSDTPQIAINLLVNNFNLIFEQAKSILDMRLQRLTGLEIKKIKKEILDIDLRKKYLELLINDNNEQFKIIISELEEIKNKFGDKRRSKIINENLFNISNLELIKKENIFIILTFKSYIRSLSFDEFKLQNKGGKGVSCLSSSISSNDFLKKIICINSIDLLLFFTNKGKVYKLNAYKIQKYSRKAKGIPLINLISIEKDEFVVSILSIDNLNNNDINKNNKYLFFATKKGFIKKTDLSQFSKINKFGKIAIKLKENDKLIEVILADENDSIILVNNLGKIVRFFGYKIKNTNRKTIGVKGINNNKNLLKTICLSSTKENLNYILSITENGLAKKTLIKDYKITSRGSKGVDCINLKNKNINLKFVKVVKGNEEILIATKKGQIIKFSLVQIPVLKRRTIGVKIIKLDSNDKIEFVEILNINN